MADNNGIIVQGESELDEFDAAVVVTEDGELRIMLPDLGDDDEVPKNVLIATALGMKVANDPAWVRQLCLETFGEQAERYFADEDYSQGPRVMGRA